MSTGIFTALSGLRAHQAWLDSIGSNIANANTPGFKSSTVVFGDLLSQTITAGTTANETSGGTNPIQIGLGARVTSAPMNFAQGSIQSTDRPTDLAIQGDGFFVLTNGADRVYSRAGSFGLDADGNLVDGASGAFVLGASGPVRFPLGQESGAVATATAAFRGNLDAAAPDGTTWLATLDVRDSLGAPHALTLSLTKNFDAAPGRWDWTVAAADDSITLDGASGSIVFDASGGLTSGATADFGIAYAAGAGVTSPQAVTLDFGSAANPTPLTGFASPSTVALRSQDGHAAGTLQSFAIGLDGTITGFYSNGRTAVLDTIQLATFTNPAGLLRAGQNHFRESQASGLPSIGAPGVGARGMIVAGALEQSNVDLAREFTSMILAERGFQANARAITTASQILEELVNIKR